MSGQVLGPDTCGAVELIAEPAGAAGPAGAPRAFELRDFGEFRFVDVAAGRYMLTLRFGDDEIVLPQIEVGAPSG